MSRSITPLFIEDHRLIMEMYGKWPVFHDCEVISLLLDRSKVLFGTTHDPRIKLTLLSFDLVVNDTASGKPVVAHTLVCFEFNDVRKVRLEDFNHQNALHSVDFEGLPLDESGNHSFRVRLNSALGLGGQFEAMKGKVLSVQRCDRHGVVTGSPY